MKLSRPFRSSGVVAFFASCAMTFSCGAAAESDLLGRWDLKVRDGAQEYPSWIQIEKSGHNTLVGGYVGRFGSVRPVSKVEFDAAKGRFRFVVPPQWERRTNDIVVEGRVEGGGLRGETINDEGRTIQWEAQRAPSMVRDREPKWGKPIELVNGRDLTGWKPRHAGAKNGWIVKDGLLSNASPGNDLVTEQKFTDFKLRAVFRYPKGSNSGLYLRGRYEAQIEDNFGREPGSHYIGGIYGFLAPRINASRPAGEWQTMEITLVGRMLTLVLNGEPVIERQMIPGITGGALDSDEGAPGPLMIQGDHGQVDFKELTIIPAE
jgi:hypothetical protein